jgi:vacuolar protein sorting-associated protein 18
MILEWQTAPQRDQILKAQANTYFEEKRYYQAAQAYAHSSAPFEEVVLKLLDVGERDSLRSYLISRLERTRKTVSRTPRKTPEHGLLNAIFRM